MSDRSLQHYLAQRPAWPESAGADLGAIVAAVAAAAARQADIIERRGLNTDSAGPGSAGDADALTRACHEFHVASLGQLPLAFIASEKHPGLIEIAPGAPLALAIDPLDGYANIATNGPVGMSFTVLAADPRSLFEQPLGRLALAAGLVLFGPQTRLLLTLGEGCLPFLLERASGEFRRTGTALRIPAGRREIAINTAHYRYWEEGVRAFIDDFIAGESGPPGEDFNLRWSGSLAAEALRIVGRGGLFLYPADARAGHHRGRLRLLFDALPLALLIEQAGGQASDGVGPILARRLEAIEQRTPLIFGGAERVREAIDYCSGQALHNSRFPLFDHRSLFRHQGP